MLSKLLEDQIGKVDYLKYMSEVGLSAQGDMFGGASKPNDTKVYRTPEEYLNNDPEWRAYLAKGKKEAAG